MSSLPELIAGNHWNEVDARHRYLHRNRQRQAGKRILKRLRSKSVGQVGISSITLGELAFGAAKSVRREEANAALAEFLLALEIASFDSDAAASYGHVHAALERRGTPIGPLDTLIGAHARALDVVLVTHNTQEFRRVDALRLEDWVS